MLKEEEKLKENFIREVRKTVTTDEAAKQMWTITYLMNGALQKAFQSFISSTKVGVTKEEVEKKINSIITGLRGQSISSNDGMFDHFADELEKISLSIKEEAVLPSDEEIDDKAFELHPI